MEKKELPVELAFKITQSAVEYANLLPFFSLEIQAAWEEGATAYATKLHQAEEKIKELERQNEMMKAQATGWRPLLEDILEMDKQDIAYISEDLVNKIKTFLYGE